MAKERFKLIPAGHLFLIRGDEVLLSLRDNTGYEDGSYSVVAGHLDGGEKVVEAAIREAREEAGIELAADEVDVVGVMHRSSDQERVDFFVVASHWSGPIMNREPEKCGGLEWYPLHDLPENMVPYVWAALDKFRDGQWFCSYGWG
jgi:8-oxo-dGTP pyrophosphatase MutT (NUDIX family)